MQHITWGKKRGAKRKLQDQRQRRNRPALEELESRIVPSGTDFRPIDEMGNNAADPTLGTAGTDLLRLSPVAYGDGISKPSMGGGSPLFIPSPRTVSNDLFNQSPTLFGSPSTDINTVDGNGMSDFGYSFGQFMDHDMDLTPDDGSENGGSGDFNIPADTTNPGDPIGSLAFGRSVFDTSTGTSTSNPRQQINAVTSYLDLSQVYGSTQEVSDALRTFSGGLLKTSPGNMLPYDTTAINPLTNAPYFTSDQIAALQMQNSGPLPEDELFAAGDVRANENTELMSLTTLFVRNHNAIATELAQQDPTQYGFTSWTDENLYQEARKINIAEYQNIIYTQYLPDLLGPTALSAYTGYNPDPTPGGSGDPSIATEFSTVAFRFGHSMLNNTVARDANNGSSLGDIPLEEDFFDPNLVNPNGVTDPTTGLVSTDIGAYLKGDADGSAQAVDTMAVSSIRDELFGNGIPGGEDLISRDIWRAHDNGIGTYNQVRVAFGLAPITDDATHGFDQITSNVQVQQELETAYAKTIANGGFAGDIDPFVGGLAEDHVPGSDLGPLFTTILTDQFSRLETGDRYFYLNESFTPAEQSILSQGSTLGQIIEANTNVTNLQSDVFINPVLSQQNATGKGFYTNKNGEAALTGSRTGTTLTTSIYNGLVAALDPNHTGTTVLVDANGNYLSDTFLQSYSNVQSFLKNATGSNMANMLSAQLLTTELNVLLGQVNATTSIFVPSIGTLSSPLQNSLATNGVSTASGVANIQNILDASIAQLLADADPAHGSSDATFEEALKDCLDGINNNETIFIL